MNDTATPDTPVAKAKRPFRKRRCTECGSSFHTREQKRLICQDCKPAKKKASTQSAPKKGETNDKS